MQEYAEIFVRWVPTANGGRHSPANLQGAERPIYLPHFRVGSDGEYLGVAFLDGDPPLGTPGEEGRAIVALVYTDTGVDYSPLRVGVEFDVLEGHRVVARGTIRRRWQSDEDWISQKLRHN